MIGWTAWLRPSARLDRWIERELVYGLPPRTRAKLHARLRQDAEARARYDRAVAALRVLEGDADLAELELDVVGRWLADDWGEPQPPPASAGARWWWPALVASAAALLLLVVGLPRRDAGALAPWWEGRDDGWQARGSASTGALALEALCVPSDPATGSARARVCRHQDLMGFAYRVEPEVTGRLTLFGVDSEGDPMFYLPTPIDADVPQVQPGQWRALAHAVRLSVNHAEGSLRIYGLVAPTAATVDEVRQWAELLAPQAAATADDEPWLDRVSPDSLARICSDRVDCHAAELRLTIDP